MKIRLKARQHWNQFVDQFYKKETGQPIWQFEYDLRKLFKDLKNSANKNLLG
jgi:hypothetical protein